MLLLKISAINSINPNTYTCWLQFLNNTHSIKSVDVLCSHSSVLNDFTLERAINYVIHT